MSNKQKKNGIRNAHTHSHTYRTAESNNNNNLIHETKLLYIENKKNSYFDQSKLDFHFYLYQNYIIYEICCPSPHTRPL